MIFIVLALREYSQPSQLYQMMPWAKSGAAFGSIYRVIPRIRTQEQGCCELVLRLLCDPKTVVIVERKNFKIW